MQGSFCGVKACLAELVLALANRCPLLTCLAVLPTRAFSPLHHDGETRFALPRRHGLSRASFLAAIPSPTGDGAISSCLTVRGSLRSHHVSDNFGGVLPVQETSGRFRTTATNLRREWALFSQPATFGASPSCNLCRSPHNTTMLSSDHGKPPTPGDVCQPAGSHNDGAAWENHCDCPFPQEGRTARPGETGFFTPLSHRFHQWFATRSAYSCQKVSADRLAGNCSAPWAH